MRSTQTTLMAAAVLGLGALCLSGFLFSDRSAAHAAEASALPAGYAPSPLFKADVVANNLRAPWAIKFLPDGRVIFTEREGRVRIIENNKLLPEPALTVSDIKSWSKMGLMGLVLDPDFAANHFVYTAEAHGVNDQQDGNWVRVVRYREDANKLIEPKVLIDQIPAFHNHAGGRLLFGPDGKLYITTGDADLPLFTQRLDTLHGKILRLNSDGSIPADNPFVNRKDANPAIWSYGHRNSQGICFQPGTGDLYETEHGPDGGDEINLVKKGANYGWPFVTHDRTATGVENPLRQFTPSIGPGDCVIYDGAMFPALKGELLVAAMRGEGILRAHLDGQKVTSVERLMFKQFGRVREVAVAPDGAIWIATSEYDPPEGRRYPNFDQILRLTPAGGTVATFDKPPEAKDIPKPVGSRNIYNTMCLSCHGDGRDLSLNSNLFDKKWHVTDGSDDEIRFTIQNGNIARGMPGFAGSLTEKEVDEMIAYIRQRESQAK
jgi:glucose/arabinose dehydrogenase